MRYPFSGPISRDHITARVQAHPLGDRAAVQRTRFAHLVLGERADTEVDAAVDVTFDGEGGTIVYFHGGGYAFGSPLTHARIGRGLAERAGMRVVLPNYPLAPEHLWPAQLDAAMAAVMGIADPVVLAGDSAGGHLALVTALELARHGRNVAGLILFSPNTDRSGLSTTRARNDPLDPMVDDEGDQQLARQCFCDMAVENRHVSPVLDDLTLLPPVYLEAGTDEVLLGDSLALAQRARAAGRAVTMHVQPDGLHMGQLWAPWWPTASASLDRAATFAREVVRGAAIV